MKVENLFNYQRDAMQLLLNSYKKDRKDDELILRSFIYESFSGS